MAKGTSSAKAEDVVRRYLTYLRSPQELVDEKAVSRAQAQVDRAVAGGDVLEHIKALANLERAGAVDEAPLREAFVAALPEWAAENEVSVEVLRSFGVPDDVLAEAKLLPRRKIERARTRKTLKAKVRAHSTGGDPEPDQPPPASNGHGGGIDYAAIAERLPPKGTTFTAADVAKVTGKSLQQGRNYVATLRKMKLVNHVGEADAAPGRGPAPHLYERV